MQRLLAWVGGIVLAALALGVVLICIARQLAVPYFEQQMFLTQTRTRATPNDFGTAFAHQTCPSGERRLDVSWVDAGANTPAVIIFHGNNETLHDWAKVQADLARRGLSTYLFDYSGFGASTGKPTVKHLNEDATAAYGCFAKRAGARPKLAFAHSLGTAVLLQSVPKLAPRPLAIATYGTFTSARQLMLYLGTPAAAGLVIPDLWNNLEAADHLGRMPLLVVAGLNDTNVTPEMGRQVAFAARRGDFKMVLNADHDDIRGPQAMTAWLPILEFYNTQLGQNGSGSRLDTKN